MEGGRQQRIKKSKRSGRIETPNTMRREEQSSKNRDRERERERERERKRKRGELGEDRIETIYLIYMKG